MRTLLALSIMLSLAAVNVSAANTTSKSQENDVVETEATVKAAQDKKDKKKKKKKANAAAKAKAVPSSDSSAAAPAVQTTTAPADAVAAAPKKKWSVGLWSETYAKMANADKGTYSQKNGDFESDNTFKVGYKLAPNTTISLHQEIDSTLGLGGNNPIVYPQDLQLRLTQSELVKFSDTLNLTAQLRAYLPTSQFSQNTGQIAQFRGYGILEKKVGKWTLSYIFNPRYFIQKDLTAADQSALFGLPTALDASGNPAQVGNSYMQLYNFITFEYALSDKWSLSQWIGYANLWSYGDPAVNVQYSRSDYALFSSFVQWAPNDNITILAGLDADGYGVSMLNQSQQFSLYRDDQMDYKLIAIITL